MPSLWQRVRVRLIRQNDIRIRHLRANPAALARNRVAATTAVRIMGAKESVQNP